LVGDDSEKIRFDGDEMRMQTWRWTEIGLLQMLEVTTVCSHSHVGSQALGEVS